MHIAVLTNNTRNESGWGRFSRELILALRRKGTRISIFSEEGGGLEGEEVILDNSLRFSLVNIWRTPLHLPVLVRNALRIRSRLRGFEAVHALDGYPYSVIAALALMGTDIPLVATMVGTYSVDALNHAIERKLLLWALGRTRAITAISAYTADEIRRQASQFFIKPIGLGTTPEALTALKQKDGGGIRQPYIISVGAVKPQKGYTVSLRAFAEAKKKFPDLSYVVVGYQGHKHFKEICELTRTLGVNESVHFFSNVSDAELVRLYDDAELFLLTPIRIGSLFEGFGLVYREAGARGLASIGSRNCGAEDAVKDGETGILVSQRDVSGVADAMEKLLTDKNLRSRMGEAGKKLAQHWTWDRVAEEYLSIYSKVLNFKSKV